MTSYYAQIDDARRVVGVTQTAEPVDDPHMVPLQSYDLGVLGKRHDLASGAFVDIPAEPAPTPTTRNVSNKAFMSRFTDDEAIDIDMAACRRWKRAGCCSLAEHWKYSTHPSIPESCHESMGDELSDCSGPTAECRDGRRT